MLFTSAASALTRLFVLIVSERLSTISRLISSSSLPNSSIWPARVAEGSRSGQGAWLPPWATDPVRAPPRLNAASSPSTGEHPNGHQRHQEGPEVHVRRAALRRGRFSVRQARQRAGVHPDEDEEYAHREHPREESTLG